MVRKLQIVNEKRIKTFREGPEWPHVARAFYNEMLPTLDFLLDDKVDANLKRCLKNYLVVTLVATIEDCLRNLARRIIDEYQLDVSKIINENITLPISLLDRIADKELTKGRLVASNFNFANPHVANEFFSKLMDVDFFGFILKMDKKDPFSFIVGRPSI